MSEALSRIYEDIKKKEHIPTSDEQLLSAVDTNIVRHDELYRVKDIQSLIKNNALIIFYDHTAGDIGHWCCLTKRNHIVEFFDPYGRNIDSEEYIGDREPYLKKLLMKTNYDVRYNPYDFQGRGRPMSTCGRHVVTRILLKDKPLSYYKKFMSNIDSNDLVSFITSPF